MNEGADQTGEAQDADDGTDQTGEAPDVDEEADQTGEAPGTNGGASDESALILTALQQTLDGVTAAQAAADSNKSVEDGMSAAASAEQNFQSAQETLSQILDQGPATNADTSADLGDAVHSILKASMVLSLKNAVEEALQETQKLRAAQAAWTAADKIENVVTRMVAKTKALEQINVEKQLLLFKILNVLDAREKLQSETMAQTPLGGNSSSPLNTPIHQ